MADPTNKLLSGACVVTGAGSGLGRSLARRLAQSGAIVAALGRQMQPLEDTASGHRNITPFRCDVSDPVALEGAFADLRRVIGPVSILINNAAMYPKRDIFDESQKSFMDTVAINLGGTFGATRLALDDMTDAGFGRIMNVATFADIAPLPASSAYSVSKGAARILSRALQADLADRFPNIVITDWLPGMLDTQMGIQGGVNPDDAAVWGTTLALMDDPSLNGATFEMTREIPPPRSLKKKLKDKLLFRTPPAPRQL